MPERMNLLVSSEELMRIGEEGGRGLRVNNAGITASEE